ncbi:thermostable hemolysin [Vibrio salinus]|uniref:thermostable hemolysin n=1 Tax=Vibrio salinus TaxID=2899784 RepID=UPI001E3987F5|nr:thermostable hemolysin [Vibrio salinus]MCE0494927.1 thermostable hemolysin [Vibrio salinus]
MTNLFSDFQLLAIGEHHPLKSSIEQHVSQRYARAFKATLSEFMPGYLALYQKRKLISVCGIRSAGNSRLFLEQYLDSPIEQIIHEQKLEVPRSQIIEFGQLASFSFRFSKIHFYLMTKYLIESGFSWCVCTVTDPLFALMESMGLEPLQIGTANPEKVKNAERWGRYYQYTPRIVVGNLQQAADQLGEMICCSAENTISRR